MAKDTLFAKRQRLITDFHFGKHTAAVFDDMLLRSVPFYVEMQRMMTEMAADFAVEGTNLYEVELRKSPPLGVRLRVEGPAPLRVLSSDADELLLTDKEQIIFEIRSALEVLDGAAVGLAATSHASLRDVQAQLRAQLIEAERDLRAPTRGGNLNPDV